MNFAFFLKLMLLLNILHCFCMFFNKYFKHFGCVYLKSEQCYNVKSSTYYFYMKTKILAGIHICVRVPLALCNIRQFHRIFKYSLIFLLSFDIYYSIKVIPKMIYLTRGTSGYFLVFV